MEALIPGSRLLPEVEYIILESFDELRDLSNASLVCRTWRRLIFPHLHRDVVVSQVPHLEGLISRLESELPDSQSRIGSYLWSLQIDIGSRKTYGGVEFLDQLWTRLALCIPKLVNLESFRWNLLYLLPLDSLLNVFGAVRTSCPRLRRVSLSSWSHKYGPAETKKVFGFKNLTHLEVEWYVPERGLHPFGVPDGIIDVIENSPDLVHLSLDIHGSESWQPIDAEFFRRLKNPLAKLSQLKIGNQAYFDGSRLLCDPPQEQSFNWFFEQHPTLRGAHLHYHLQGSQPSGVDLSPAVVQSLFRSITSFTGPVSLCTAVIQSPLANQLQSLKVIYGGPSHCSVAPFADAMKPLPLLRELHFLFHRHFPDRVGPVMYDYSTLGRILGMTPLLQTFGLDYWQVHLRLMTQYLSHVPLLSDLSIQTRLVDTSSVNETSVAQLLETCPRLRRVRFIGEWHETQVFVCKPVWRQQSSGYI